MPFAHGSLSKEFPLSQIDQTIQAIQQGWDFDTLRHYAEQSTNGSIPTLLEHQFLLVDRERRIGYDRFLSLVSSEPLSSPRARKVMYFTWFFRDDRLRQIICEHIRPRRRMLRFAGHQQGLQAHIKRHALAQEAFRLQKGAKCLCIDGHDLAAAANSRDAPRGPCCEIVYWDRRAAQR
jgi:hypothetical protein